MNNLEQHLSEREAFIEAIENFIEEDVNNNIVDVTLKPKNKYFVFDPKTTEFAYFATLEQAVTAAEILISECHNGYEWDFAVENIIVGQLTHMAECSNNRVHRLKIEPVFFNAVVEGKKSFEIRRNDRNYQPGDTVLLCEFREKYTGRQCKATITMITAYQQREDYVVFGLADIGWVSW